MKYLGLKGILIGFMLTQYTIALSQKKITREEYSPLEDPATDIPRTLDKFTWTIRDTIAGQKISTDGAPVVVFRMGEPIIVSSVATGTPITLTTVTTFKGINYWPVDYIDEKGKQKEGWVSGMFLQRN